VSLAYRIFQAWLDTIADSLVAIWHNDEFEDRQARALTMWVAGHCLPSPPANLSESGRSILADNTPSALLTCALFEAITHQNWERSNQALAAIAESLGIDELTYSRLMTDIVDYGN
jgi:exoribonuclease II